MDSDLAPTRLRQLPSWLLTQNARIATRLVSHELDALGAHRRQFAVLAALEEFGPASQADLGRRCGIDRSDMVALVNDLSAADQVDRAPDPAGGRRNVVTITSTGRKRLRTLTTRLSRVQDELLAPLSARERTQLIDLLQRVLDGQSWR
jgi:DNA-binding MarR family transcriptional regulator